MGTVPIGPYRPHIDTVLKKEYNKIQHTMQKGAPMKLDQTIRTFLQSYKNKTILLQQLEKLCSGEVTYIDFATVIERLVQEEILTAFKNGQLTTQEPRLYYKYRFHKPRLNREMTSQIQAAQKTYDTLNLSEYYHLNQLEWKQDLPYIKQINEYLLENNTLPKSEILQTELAFQLVGDEKWIEQGKGQRILERLGLWESLQIQKHPDPLMFAVNPSKIGPDKHTHFHLAVENKSTYHALLEELPNTMFTTLIYGQGWKITANITELEKQLPILSPSHEIYYFGDLDYEGIAIWHKLNQVRRVCIAKPFYKKLLKQKKSQGIKNQNRNDHAIKCFLNNFKKDQEVINNLLFKNHYYPQEAIRENELREVFRNYNLDDK